MSHSEFQSPLKLVAGHYYAHSDAFASLPPDDLARLSAAESLAKIARTERFNVVRFDRSSDEVTDRSRRRQAYTLLPQQPLNYLAASQEALHLLSSLSPKAGGFDLMRGGRTMISDICLPLRVAVTALCFFFSLTHLNAREFTQDGLSTGCARINGTGFGQRLIDRPRIRVSQDRKPASCCNAQVKTCCE
jgi:hypothetical protein